MRAIDGVPDNYTNIEGAKRTNRYQAVGNSWAVPVVRWIGGRLLRENTEMQIHKDDLSRVMQYLGFQDAVLYNMDKGIIECDKEYTVNCTEKPEECVFKTLKDIVSPNAPDEIYLSPVGCYGIIRRKRERKVSINERLEEVLLSIASNMSEEEIERKSRIQQRGKYARFKMAGG